MSERLVAFQNVVARLALPVALLSLFSFSNSAMAAPQNKAPATKNTVQRKAPPVNNSAALTGYWNRLRVRLQNNWQVPDGKNTVVLTANIASDGSSTDVSVEGHPKDSQAEVSATEAFNKTLPLEALPSGVGAARLTVNFEYQYDPHGDGYSKVSGQISQTAAPAASQPTGATPSEGSKF